MTTQIETERRTRRIHAPTPNGKRLVVQKVTLDPVILKGTNVQLPEAKNLQEAVVLAVGPLVDILVRLYAADGRQLDHRLLAEGDIITFNPKVSGQDISALYELSEGNVTVLFEGDVILAKAVEDPEAGQIAADNAVAAQAQPENFERM